MRFKNGDEVVVSRRCGGNGFHWFDELEDSLGKTGTIINCSSGDGYTVEFTDSHHGEIHFYLGSALDISSRESIFNEEE